MTSPVYQHSFANGLTLLVESMPHVRSATVSFLIPAGAVHDPADRPGLATILSELMSRGAGSRNSQELSAAFDNLGVDRGESVDVLNLGFSGGTLARNIPAALELFADVLRRPHLPESDLEPAQALALQDLQALEDSPQDKVMLELRKRYLPPPLNADKLGTAESIPQITIGEIRRHFQAVVQPKGAILAIAGNVEGAAIRDKVASLFEDWEPGQPAAITPRPHAPRSTHLGKDTQQTQIALAFPSVPITDPGYYAARAAVNVLSGGMSSRLFTEVREKRGLCYSVYATHDTFPTFGTVYAYAGTRNDRAQETLDVLVAELRKLGQGVETDEIDRVKAGLKSALIMRQESTAARAGAIAADWYFLGRVRPFEEIQAAIDGLTPDRVVEHARRYPADAITVLTLGPKELTIPD